MMIRSLTFICVIFLSISMSYAQRLKSFSEDFSTFRKEYSELLSRNITKEQSKLMGNFLEALETDAFLSGKKADVVAHLNLYLKKKSRPFPDMELYMIALLNMQASAESQGHYEGWKRALTSLLEHKKMSRTKINEFVRNTGLFFEQKSLSKGKHVSWFSSSSQVAFSSENDLPVLKFENINLSCVVREDTTRIIGTSGSFYPVENVWKGMGGKVTWERAGYQPTNVWADLQDYEINLNKSSWVANEVDFHYTEYFEEVLKGSIEDKVKHVNKPNDATYPKFNSSETRFQIKNLYDNIDYEGGFALHGAKLIGRGSDQDKAHLYIYNNDTLFLQAASKFFSITKEKITSANTQIIIKLAQDSIYHPDLKLNYVAESQELTLARTEKYTSQSPFFDSYHKLDMTFDQIVWNFGDPSLLFTMHKGATVGNAKFESASYFDRRKYDEIQMVDEINPLVRLKKYAVQNGHDEFYGSAYADYLRLPLTEAQRVLIRLAQMGFIFYDLASDEVVVKDKLYEYLESSIGRRDYDVLSFRSETQAPQENASLDLSTFELTINGMPQVQVSDSQNVNIFPANDQIVMGANRSFKFDGVVEAGLFTLYGKNYNFNYDSFKLNLPNIDTVAMKYITDEKDAYGYNLLADVKSVIQHVTGEILIDKPDNKSGRESYSEYPILTSKEKSYVYYNDSSIHNGAYKADSFYFHVDPFTIDSLDNFNKDGLFFPGYFYGAAIVPDMIHTLSLQKDASLGFAYKTPPDGVPMYDNHGQYFDTIFLSNEGLTGSGEIEYITSLTKSEKFVFLPDSMIARKADFEVKYQSKEAGTPFPKVVSEGSRMNWKPFKEIMYHRQFADGFNMYNDSTSLDGELILQPTGLTGRGALDMSNASLTSQDYTFSSDDFKAKQASFIINSLNEGIAVKTDSMDVFIDFNKEKGHFTAREKISRVEFPDIQYVSQIDALVWDMKSKEVRLGVKDEELEKKNQMALSDTAVVEIDFKTKPQGNTYVSLDPKQDSLTFVSSYAFFNYRDYLLNASNVNYFYVADAKLFPKAMKVIVESTGKMRKFENATLIANTKNNFHHFHSADIQVNGKNSYSGSGDYDFKDENNSVQTIHFQNIALDDSMNTTASADLIELDNFKLSPQFDFQGKVKINAKYRYLTFDGSIRIVQECSDASPRWLNVSSNINPDSIYIPLPEDMFDINGKQIFTGTVVNIDSTYIYPLFFDEFTDLNDKTVISTEGYLYYDKEGSKYKIAALDKLQDFTLPGNFLSLSNEFCELYGEGEMDLHLELGSVFLKTVGNTNHDIKTNLFKANVIMGMDFHIPANIAKIMAKDLDSIPTLKPVNLKSNTYRKAIQQLIGEDASLGYFKDISLYGKVDKLPKELLHTILFADVKYVWNDNAKSYQSIGKIGIGSINKEQVNKYVEGFIEMRKKRTGDLIDIYLKMDNRNWYYFGYDGRTGVMQVLSSNKDYVTSIYELKKKDRSSKDFKSDIDYSIIVSTDEKLNKFIGRWDKIKEERETGAAPF